VVVAAFHHHAPGIEYQPLFEEEQGLYCGRENALFARADRVDSHEIEGQRFVIRGYMGERQTPRRVAASPSATVYNMEALTLLLLTGRFVGYLPRHAARTWEESGRLREIRAELFGYSSTFEMACRRNQVRSPATRGFLRCLNEAHRIREPAWA
jgi:DNA-binding transcriptional LysR family regulator